MALKIAVVTDALSPGFIFPIWYRYYGSLFGAENLFLVTYRGCAGAFREFAFGGMTELPAGYDDETRRGAIGRLVTSLLTEYDCVVRVDADEFVVVDPRRNVTLREFIETFRGPYLSARGFDVIQLTGEPALPEAPNFPILRDRAYAYPNTALNKTCIVRRPMDWCVGFHWATVFPHFGPIFMLHMKRLDIGWQLGWFGVMSENIRTNPAVPDSLRTYYNADEAAIRAYHQAVGGRQRQAGMEAWYRHDLMRDFLDGIRRDPASGIYAGTYGHELVLCEIPPAWKSLLLPAGV